MINPERLHNAFAALDILARADSASFAKGRADAPSGVDQETEFTFKLHKRGEPSKSVTVKAYNTSVAIDRARRANPGWAVMNDTARGDAAPMSVREAKKLGKEYVERGNSRQRLMEVLRAEGADGAAMRAGLEAYDAG
jgi:hypothetical protein